MVFPVAIKGLRSRCQSSPWLQVKVASRVLALFQVPPNPLHQAFSQEFEDGINEDGEQVEIQLPPPAARGWGCLGEF